MLSKRACNDKYDLSMKIRGVTSYVFYLDKPKFSKILEPICHSVSRQYRCIQCHEGGT